MHDPNSHPARGYYIFHPEDLDTIKREAELEVIPLAIRRGSFVEGTTAADILRELQADPTLMEADPQAPKQRAAVMLRIVIFFLAEATTKRHQDMLSDWDVEAAAGARLMTHLFGYLSALDDQARENARPANEGRRAHRAKRDEQLAEAAKPYAGTMSKDRAAPLIAQKLGLEPSTVRKRLAGITWESKP